MLILLILFKNEKTSINSKHSLAAKAAKECSEIATLVAKAKPKLYS
jgi:hypothetical protein